jgi:hypothetical protein
MLFLVISNPLPSRPKDVKSARLKIRSWIENLKSIKKVIAFYPRVGRGSVVIFNVTSNDELHKLMTEWSDIVPVSFVVYPLATPSEAEELLR